ncbi:type II and III secretion system protein family protein [Vibrio sp. JC009]|uniref:type II and III secretion system protein family protein n=1 Tax=Vibrio sp. JC009 TaxID=2912314 RepID=UPI0023B14B61|nr:type II and III secretion system protein family protein [Vibrio sp. JC009]WED22297.1 type II and III secretion system protein family protein [Vibrio sp. JC009]
MKYSIALFWIALVSLSGLAVAASTLSLSEGEAKAISLAVPVESAFTSDSAIVDYQVIDNQKIIVFGKKTGQAAFMAFDDTGKTVINHNVFVTTSYKELELQIHTQFPHSDIRISGIGKQVVLSGQASSDEEKQRIYQMAGELLGKKANDLEFELEGDDDDSIEVDFMTRSRYDGIVNNIEVSATKQVNVKLTIAEVSHSFAEQFGIQMGSNGSPGVFVDQLSNFSSSDIVSVITAINNENLGQVLAEPNLSVISGEQASFLVGGELPVVTVFDGSTNVEYKEFGIKLELMARVLRDDKIKLSLMPEVSSLDAQYKNALYDLPALKTRRAQTTIELGDGQSFVLGGLLNKEDRESLSRIPFIGDIPILGALFRHTETENNKTELIIVATVNLVKPVKGHQIQVPRMKKSTTLSRFFALTGNSDSNGGNHKGAEEVLVSGGFKK